MSLNSNTTGLEEILASVNALPEAGGGGGSGGGGIEYEIVTIPANIGSAQCTVPYSLSRVTGAYGGCSLGWESFFEEGIILGVKDNSLCFVDSFAYNIQSKKSGMDTADEYITYSNGTMSFWFSHNNPNSIDVFLINDPSAEAISN